MKYLSLSGPTQSDSQLKLGPISLFGNIHKEYVKQCVKRLGRTRWCSWIRFKRFSNVPDVSVDDGTKPKSNETVRLNRHN